MNELLQAFAQAATSVWWFTVGYASAVVVVGKVSRR